MPPITCEKCGWTTEPAAFHLGCSRCGTKHPLAEQMPAYEEKANETAEAESVEDEAEAGSSDEVG